MNSLIILAAGGLAVSIWYWKRAKERQQEGITELFRELVDKSQTPEGKEFVEELSNGLAKDKPKT